MFSVFAHSGVKHVLIIHIVYVSNMVVAL